MDLCCVAPFWLPSRSPSAWILWCIRSNHLVHPHLHLLASQALITHWAVGSHPGCCPIISKFGFGFYFKILFWLLSVSGIYGNPSIRCQPGKFFFLLVESVFPFGGGLFYPAYGHHFDFWSFEGTFMCKWCLSMIEYSLYFLFILRICLLCIHELPRLFSVLHLVLGFTISIHELLCLVDRGRRTFFLVADL
jgi:hypothetical protein